MLQKLHRSPADLGQEVLVDKDNRPYNEDLSPEAIVAMGLRRVDAGFGRFFDSEGVQYSLAEIRSLSPERIRELGVFYTQV